MGTVEVLSGRDEPARTRSTARRAALPAVLLLGAAALGGQHWVERRAEVRAERAAFAALDAVHLQGSVRAVTEDGSAPGLLLAHVEVDAPGHEGEGDVLRDVRLVGPGLQPRVLAEPPVGALPRQVLPQALVDCDRVAAGELPPRAEVVLQVRVRSGRDHERRVPVEPGLLREGALASCGLPDPEAVPVVELSGLGEELLLYVEPVPRDPDGVVLQRVDVPGWRLSSPHVPLPHAVRSGTGLLLGLRPELQDCAAAAGADEASVVLLRDGRRTVRRLDLSVLPTGQPQPGAVSAARLLERAQRSC